jgi:hypothetical protein
MNVRSLKLAGAAAGVLFLVGAAPNVFAQSAVLNLNNSDASGTRSAPFYSTFTLNRSMILNSVGFISINNSTTGAQNHNYFYKIMNHLIELKDMFKVVVFMFYLKIKTQPHQLIGLL